MFFNTLGLIAHITLQPNFLYQEVCRKKFDWDELINVININAKWSKFLVELGALRLLNAPRHVLCCEERGVEMHRFLIARGRVIVHVVLFVLFVSTE